MSRRRPDLDDLAVEWDCADSWRRSLERRRAAEQARRRMRADHVETAANVVVLFAIAAVVAVAIAVLAPAV